MDKTTWQYQGEFKKKGSGISAKTAKIGLALLWVGGIAAFLYIIRR
jgi:hypothetical protein